MTPTQFAALVERMRNKQKAWTDYVEYRRNNPDAVYHPIHYYALLTEKQQLEAQVDKAIKAMKNTEETTINLF